MANVHLSQLRLAVRPHRYDYIHSTAPVDDVVEVYVDGRELTALGAGLGMPAWDILALQHAWRATDEPRTVPFARCGCGTYGCGSTDVTIVRDGSLVLWTFSIEVPDPVELVFDADAYDAELARSLADHSWERPGVTAGRLVRERLDQAALAERGLRLLWACPRFDEPGRFEVCLQLREGEAEYQVFLGVPGDWSDPQATASRMLSVLDAPPTSWDAAWLPNTRIQEPPALLGGTGHRYSL